MSDAPTSKVTGLPELEQLRDAGKANEAVLTFLRFRREQQVKLDRFLDKMGLTPYALKNVEDPDGAAAILVRVADGDPSMRDRHMATLLQKINE